jgi:hypothetical protein
LSTIERHHPPTVAFFSSRSASAPRWYAADRPVGPAPTITQGTGCSPAWVGIGLMTAPAGTRASEDGADGLREPAAAREVVARIWRI